MKYRVYFEQVNQCYIEVEAETIEIAKRRATAEWKEDNKHPDIRAIEKAEFQEPVQEHETT